jgi:hypothetical protein
VTSKLKVKLNGLVDDVTARLDTPFLCVLDDELHRHGSRS